MKKMLLASAFALFGTFAMANEVELDINNSTIENVVINSEEQSITAPCSSWTKVVSCKTYWLCNDNYLDKNGNMDFEKLMDATDYFDNQKGC